MLLITTFAAEVPIGPTRLKVAVPTIAVPTIVVPTIVVPTVVVPIAVLGLLGIVL